MHQSLIPADQLDDFIIIRIRAFARKVQRAILAEALCDEDTPMLEWQLLFSVARFGTCHLAHITARTSIDPAHGSRAITALERKGLIERHEDPDNRRRKLISLTPAGRAKFERIWPRARQVMKQVTDELSNAAFNDFKELLKLANLAADNLSQSEWPSGPHRRTKEEDRLSA